MLSGFEYPSARWQVTEGGDIKEQGILRAVVPPTGVFPLRIKVKEESFPAGECAGRYIVLSWKNGRSDTEACTTAM